MTYDKDFKKKKKKNQIAIVIVLVVSRKLTEEREDLPAKHLEQRFMVLLDLRRHK